MARLKGKSASCPSPETVAELQNLYSDFTQLLHNTGIDAHKMRGDLGLILDLYIEMRWLINHLVVKTDPHLSKLFEAVEAKK